MTSYDVYLSNCAYKIVACSVFIIMLQALYFIKKEHLRAFIIILGVTMKAVAFKSLPEINGFVGKLEILFMINLLQ